MKYLWEAKGCLNLSFLWIRCFLLRKEYDENKTQRCCGKIDRIAKKLWRCENVENRKAFISSVENVEWVCLN